MKYKPRKITNTIGKDTLEHRRKGLYARSKSWGGKPSSRLSRRQAKAAMRRSNFQND